MMPRNMLLFYFIFYILNSNTKTIYFNNLVFSKARVREAAARSEFDRITANLVKEYDDEFKDEFESLDDIDFDQY